MSDDKPEGVVNVGSKPEHTPDKGLETTESEVDRAEVLSAAGISLASHDADLPCLTLRMWVIGIGFCLLGSGLNTLYTFRYPSITLSQAAIQFLAFPLGRLWERVVPDWTISIFGWKLHLNRGRFNHKENILVFIMANLSFFTRLSADVLTEQRVFYGVKCGWGFEIIITLATILFGFSLAGLCRAIIVEPPAIMWPGVFGDTALNHALHFAEKERKDSTGWKTSRYKFFLIAFSISFCWYWFPDFIFPALGYFTFVCWIAPENAVVNQIFGMKSGIGLMPLTFDWSQIAYISSPLIAPPWAIINLLASLVFWIYIISPALYYTNTWYSGFLPIQSNSVFDNMAKTYNVSKVIDRSNGFQFDPAKYNSYSPLYMPVTYALNMFGLSFATIPALLIWIGLEKRMELKAAFKGALNFKRHLRTEQRSDVSVPTWWYLISCAISVALGMFACEYYPVQLRWYGAVFAFVISSVMFVPLAMVYATTNLKINIDVFCRIVAGYVFEGKVLANVWFFDLGYISGVKGLQFAQDLKLGLYCNIPARKLFLVQCVSLVVSTLCQVGVVNWALNHIPDICTTDAVNGFTCPFSRVHFNSSIIWGAIGPRRFFSPGSTYHPLLYFFLLGGVLPVIVWILKRRYPGGIWGHVHVPLFLGGLNYIPPASGTNYGSWAIVGLVFGVVVRQRAWQWWQRYNFVLSSALDCSVAIAGVIIFFAIFYSGASKQLSWWGTQVYKNTCDWKACPFHDLGKGEKFGV